MPRNLADAISELAAHKYSWKFHGGSNSTYENQIQSQGSKLEEIVKDILCGVIFSKIHLRDSLHKKYLAHEGEANNPPDAMYRGGNLGDSFEIKKIDSPSKTSLELNSSYPYSHLNKNMSRLTEAAKSCENWTKRDLFYAIGNIQWGRELGNWIWFVQGAVFVQNTEFYEKIEKDLKPAIAKTLTANGLNSSQTNELGRANKIDLLKRTNLRVRGMWIVDNPTRTFADLNGVNQDLNCHLVVHTLLLKNKWNNLVQYMENKELLEQLENNENYQISDVSIDDPNSLEHKIECKLIRIVIN